MGSKKNKRDVIESDNAGRTSFVSIEEMCRGKSCRYNRIIAGLLSWGVRLEAYKERRELVVLVTGLKYSLDR